MTFDFDRNVQLRNMGLLDVEANSTITVSVLLDKRKRYLICVLYAFKREYIPGSPLT
jgi:hypothetical protein